MFVCVYIVCVCVYLLSLVLVGNEGESVADEFLVLLGHVLLGEFRIAATLREPLVTTFPTATACIVVMIDENMLRIETAEETTIGAIVLVCPCVLVHGVVAER